MPMFSLTSAALVISGSTAGSARMALKPFGILDDDSSSHASTTHLITSAHTGGEICCLVLVWSFADSEFSKYSERSNLDERIKIYQN
ncbi:unnamed protein product [Phytophthora fragariaefolia]|uniref:Unnamed protein product n=1 Tax=Phytophthora fragariaefolia TaxID=1490495 RepID=A0A9W6Y7F6_9STRA|nr:unnamed protein product [Phytophthora fragariaefolia]